MFPNGARSYRVIGERKPFKPWEIVALPLRVLHKSNKSGHHETCISSSHSILCLQDQALSMILWKEKTVYDNEYGRTFNSLVEYCTSEKSFGGWEIADLSGGNVEDKVALHLIVAKIGREIISPRRSELLRGTVICGHGF